jgi:aquaporin Z
VNSVEFRERDERRESVNKYLAELIGTFVLVFASCGSAVLAGDKIGYLGVSLAFGLSLLAVVYAIGPISGCHINPAVTIGLLISKKMNARLAPGYIVAQIAGAILAVVADRQGRTRWLRSGSGGVCR